MSEPAPRPVVPLPWIEAWGTPTAARPYPKGSPDFAADLANPKHVDVLAGDEEAAA